MYAPVPLPGYGYEAGDSDGAAIAASVAAWVDSAALRDLVSCFGEVFPTGSTQAQLRELDEISGRHWNYRAGNLSRAHARASTRDLVFPPDTEDQVLASATALGLVRMEDPARSSYDHILILGSYLDACIARAGRAAELMAGKVSAPQVWGLAGLRVAEDHDLHVARRLQLAEPQDEVAAMSLAIRRAFPIEESEPDRGPLRGLVAGTATAVSVVAAPPSGAGHRANTADTYRRWAVDANLGPGDHLLLITTTYFVPFQHCDALRVLGLAYGCGIETIGIDPAASSEEQLRYSLTAADYLMEIRSAIRSMRSLYGQCFQASSPGLTHDQH